MNIAVDIDDTLTDSFGYFQPFLSEYYGMPLEEMRQKNISYTTMPEEWADREQDFGRKYYQAKVADTTFKPDAAWGISELKKRGHRIIIITARNERHFTDPYPCTEKELENGGILYDKLICTLDKMTACLEEDIDLLIDDKIKNCDLVEAAGIPAVVFTSPANKDKEVRHRRVNSWAEVLKLSEFC